MTKNFENQILKYMIKVNIHVYFTEVHFQSKHIDTTSQVKFMKSVNHSRYKGYTLGTFTKHMLDYKIYLKLTVNGQQ